MTNRAERTASLREAIEAAPFPSTDETVDYRITIAMDGAFVARARSGALTLLVPLKGVPVAIGRQGGGFSLHPVTRLAFEHDGLRWEQAAASLECTEPGLLEAFMVLVVDIVDRLISLNREATWQDILAWVDEWQSLLARRNVMSMEEQLGLWGELSVILNSADLDKLVAAWRGPESEAVDFFLDGVGLEVKASRHRNLHHVSQRQISSPVGNHESFVMSMWVGIDPEGGLSLSELVDTILRRVEDASSFLKKLAVVGYVPVDREQYTTRFIPLEHPSLYRVQDVPRVHQVDPGVSQLRYVVTLDPDRALDEEPASILLRHFGQAALGPPADGRPLR